jgi:3-polyprenyl-4-hydroxybenzoate decarboxylase
MPRHVYNRPHKLRFGLVCHDCITTAEQDQLLREIFNTVSHDIETTEMTYLPEQSKFALLCEQVAGAFAVIALGVKTP